MFTIRPPLGCLVLIFTGALPALPAVRERLQAGEQRLLACDGIVRADRARRFAPAIHPDRLPAAGGGSGDVLCARVAHKQTRAASGGLLRHAENFRRGLHHADGIGNEDQLLRHPAFQAEAFQLPGLRTDAPVRNDADVCKARFAHVGVITNGGVGSQTGKLKSLGLERWVPEQLVFISDAVGVMKPAPEIFRMAQKAAGGGPCLFVGDSCTQDIAGAAACGWQTIWMNRRGETPGPVRPDYTVTSEQALLTCLQTLADSRQSR